MKKKIDEKEKWTDKHPTAALLVYALVVGVLIGVGLILIDVLVN